MHSEKKLNKHKKIGNIATHSAKEVFMVCPLYDSKHDSDDCKSFKEKDFTGREQISICAEIIL